MQEWVKETGARVCVVFEGVDSAGKGGTIQRIMERTSPRVFKHMPCRPRTRGYSHKCTSSAILRTSPRPARS